MRLALLIFMLSTSVGLADAPGEVALGKALREATLTGLNGSSRNLSDYRGRPLIINVWASWCEPCRNEMASLERLAWLNAARDITVIGISTDDDPEQAKAWLKHSNATISQFIDSHLTMENMLGAKRLPLTVMVSAEGRVLSKIYGAQQWDSPDALRRLHDTFRSNKP